MPSESSFAPPLVDVGRIRGHSRNGPANRLRADCPDVRNRPQVLGFSMVHEFPYLFILGLLAFLAGYAWVAVFLLGEIRNRVTRRVTFAQRDWAQCALLAGALAVPYIPYSGWQIATLELAGPGSGAVGQLALAARETDRVLVRTLLHAEVSVNLPAKYGGTPLNHACGARTVVMAIYLIARGARLDDAPDCRKIPEFRAQMKPEPLEPDSGLPKVPGTTVEVHAQDH
jgi:hypothetical protein